MAFQPSVQDEIFASVVDDVDFEFRTTPSSSISGDDDGAELELDAFGGKRSKSESDPAARRSSLEAFNELLSSTAGVPLPHLPFPNLLAEVPAPLDDGFGPLLSGDSPSAASPALKPLDALFPTQTPGQLLTNTATAARAQGLNISPTPLPGAVTAGTIPERQPHFALVRSRDPNKHWRRADEFILEDGSDVATYSKLTDFDPFDVMLLEHLCPFYAPYQILSATLSRMTRDGAVRFDQTKTVSIRVNPRTKRYQLELKDYGDFMAMAKGEPEPVIAYFDPQSAKSKQKSPPIVSGRSGEAVTTSPNSSPEHPSHASPTTSGSSPSTSPTPLQLAQTRLCLQARRFRLSLTWLPARYAAPVESDTVFFVYDRKRKDHKPDDEKKTSKSSKPKAASSQAATTASTAARESQGTSRQKPVVTASSRGHSPDSKANEVMTGANSPSALLYDPGSRSPGPILESGDITASRPTLGVAISWKYSLRQAYLCLHLEESMTPGRAPVLWAPCTYLLRLAFQQEVKCISKAVTANASIPSMSVYPGSSLLSSSTPPLRSTYLDFMLPLENLVKFTRLSPSLPRVPAQLLLLDETTSGRAEMLVWSTDNIWSFDSNIAAALVQNKDAGVLVDWTSLPALFMFPPLLATPSAAPLNVLQPIQPSVYATGSSELHGRGVLGSFFPPIPAPAFAFEPAEREGGAQPLQKRLKTSQVQRRARAASVDATGKFSGSPFLQITAVDGFSRDQIHIRDVSREFAELSFVEQKQWLETMLTDQKPLHDITVWLNLVGFLRNAEVYMLGSRFSGDYSGFRSLEPPHVGLHMDAHKGFVDRPLAAAVEQMVEQSLGLYRATLAHQTAFGGKVSPRFPAILLALQNQQPFFRALSAFLSASQVFLDSDQQPSEGSSLRRNVVSARDTLAALMSRRRNSKGDEAYDKRQIGRILSGNIQKLNQMRVSQRSAAPASSSSAGSPPSPVLEPLRDKGKDPQARLLTATISSSTNSDDYEFSHQPLDRRKDESQDVAAAAWDGVALQGCPMMCCVAWSVCSLLCVPCWCTRHLIHPRTSNYYAAEINFCCSCSWCCCGPCRRRYPHPAMYDKRNRQAVRGPGPQTEAMSDTSAAGNNTNTATPDGKATDWDPDERDEHDMDARPPPVSPFASLPIESARIASINLGSVREMKNALPDKSATAPATAIANAKAPATTFAPATAAATLPSSFTSSLQSASLPSTPSVDGPSQSGTATSIVIAPSSSLFSSSLMVPRSERERKSSRASALERSLEVASINDVDITLSELMRHVQIGEPDQKQSDSPDLFMVSAMKFRVVSAGPGGLRVYPHHSSPSEEELPSALPNGSILRVLDSKGDRFRHALGWSLWRDGSTEFLLRCE